MSSTSDGSYGGLSALAIINLGIWIPIIVMISAYFMCSTKYRYCKSIRTGKWCCLIKRSNDVEDFDNAIILRNEVGSRVNDNDSDIYRISSGIGFESLEELQLWYNNFEENREQPHTGVISNSSTRRNAGRSTPPPSYASLYSRDDDVPSYDDLPKFV